MTEPDLYRIRVHGGGFGRVGQPELDAMYRLRYRVFKERLGWHVSGSNGIERDRFDDLDPVYLILQDDKDVVGSVRLLRTTGPHMLRDVFHATLGGRPGPSGPSIWESTRFAVDMKAGSTERARQLSPITSRLLAGIWEVAIAAGLSEIVSVYDARMARLLTRAGCTIDPLGRVQHTDGTVVHAGRFPINVEGLCRIRAVGGLTGAMLPRLVSRESATSSILPASTHVSISGSAAGRDSVAGA